jgi:ketosteroid isomerase-like protein
MTNDVRRGAINNRVGPSSSMVRSLDEQTDQRRLIMNNGAQQLEKLVEDWAAAELHGDTTFLGSALADDFVGIGPRGFMLTRDQWLERHESGDLKYESFQLDGVQVRVYGNAAVMIGRETATAKYQGQAVPGQFRATLIFVEQHERWLLAGLHLSPIAGRP